MEQRRSDTHQDQRVARSSGKPITITRQHLYQEIWRTSMKAVAGKLGISTQRLSKICDHFSIPYPKASQRGRKASKQPPPPPLPTVPTSTRDTITVTSPSAQISGETQNWSERDPDFGEPYHPELKVWVRNYLQRRRHFNPASTEQIPPNIQRLLQILNRLFHAAQEKGLVPKVTDPQPLRYVHFLYEGVSIDCELRETKIRVTVSTSGADQRQLQDTGKLLFRIQNATARDLPIKPEWHEKKVGPLDKCVGAIVEALMLAGPVVVQAHNETLVRQRRWEAERREIARREEAARTEASHRRALYKAAALHRRARELHELIAALESAEHDPTTSVGQKSIDEWLTWTKAQLARIDPLSEGIVTFFKRIDGVTKSGP